MPYDRAYQYTLNIQWAHGPLDLNNGLLASYLALPKAAANLEAMVPTKVDPITFRGQQPKIRGGQTKKRKELQELANTLAEQYSNSRQPTVTNILVSAFISMII